MDSGEVAAAAKAAREFAAKGTPSIFAKILDGTIPADIIHDDDKVQLTHALFVFNPHTPFPVTPFRRAIRRPPSCSSSGAPADILSCFLFLQIGALPSKERSRPAPLLSTNRYRRRGAASATTTSTFTTVLPVARHTQLPFIELAQSLTCSLRGNGKLMVYFLYFVRTVHRVPGCQPSGASAFPGHSEKANSYAGKS